MNKYRRNRLREIIKRLSEILDGIEEIRDEEEECISNMPENLTNSVRYENAENACDEKIETFKSIIDAERKTSISNGSIGDCLHGRRKTAGGYIWEYAV